jgi:hypothetical protein
MPKKIAEFGAKDTLMLKPHPNGGWTVSKLSSERGVMDTSLGAYTNSTDLLDALTEALPVQSN